MERTVLVSIANKYFDAFENKNIDALGILLDNEVRLTDPFIKTITNKENVLSTNQSIFNDVKEIKFVKRNLFIDELNGTIIGELNIKLDELLLEVIDIIHVTKEGFIDSIIAYINPFDK